LTPGDLVTLRAAMSAALRTPCVIERQGTGVQDDLGGTEFPVERVRSACAVAPIRQPREVQQAGRPVAVADARVLLPWGAAVSPGDAIVVPAQGGGEERYQVLATDPARTDDLCLACDCARGKG
jgi:hypothetical protein